MPPKKSKKTNKHNQDWTGDDDNSVGESFVYLTYFSHLWSLFPSAKIANTDAVRHRISIAETVREYVVTANLLHFV